MKPKFLLIAILFIMAGRASGAAPTITSFSPGSGPVGTLVTINGTNLGSPTAFGIGGASAIVVSNTGTQLVGLVMPGAVTGAISVTTTAGTVNSFSHFVITPPTPFALTPPGGYLQGSGYSNFPQQGCSIALSADNQTAAIGGSNDNNGLGAVWVYTRSGRAWIQQGSKLVGTTPFAQSSQGSSVAISADGNTIAVGGAGDDGGIGAMWVFTRSGGVWSQQASELIGSGGIGNSAQGAAISISADGNTFIEGAPYDNNDIGAAWVFTRSAGVWSQEGSKLVGSGYISTIIFQGLSVGISADGNTAIIGGEGDNSFQGAAWVFTQNDGSWSQETKLTGTGFTGASRMGCSVAVSADGNTAVAGGYADNSGQGAIWAFTQSAGTWSQLGNKFVGNGVTNFAKQGTAVAISADGSTVAEGGDNDNAGSGASWVFTLSAGNYVQVGSKLVGDAGTSGANQGDAIAISADGSNVFIGGPSNASGVGGVWVFSASFAVATTQAATSVASTTATLNGAVNDNGNTTNVKMEYGTDPNLVGSTTATLTTGTSPIPAGTGNTNFTSALTGLTAGTTYYFRIDGTNSYGTNDGSILSFTTAAGSTNANLANLQISSGTLNPAFAAATLNYTANVSNATTSITVTPTTSDPAAAVTVKSIAVASGTASGAITLNPGANAIPVTVTAPDGVTTQTYTVTVTRAASSVATLSLLKPSRGTLSPVFSSTTTSYTASVVNGVTSLTITPTATDPTAAIKVDGTVVASGSASPNLPLLVGANSFPIKVTAADGITTKTYTLVVTRGPSANCYLSNLKPSAGSLSPAFSASNTAYTTAVVNGAATITITPFTAVPTSTVTVNSATVASGAASAPIALSVGANPIAIVVTAQDGTTTRTYTLTVTRAPSTNANLSAFKISKGTLTPAFATGTTSYTASVVNGVTSMTVTPTAADITATITVNGATVASGTASGAIELAVGSNAITTLITAQDGTTTKTYTLTVTRASGGVDSFDPGISVTTPTETPKIADDGILVHQAVSPNGDGINDFLQIDNIANYPKNKLIIMNRNGQLIYEASGYNNNTKVFDGHSNKNGQMQLPGTYFYQLDYTESGITKHKTGFIVLKY